MRARETWRTRENTQAGFVHVFPDHIRVYQMPPKLVLDVPVPPELTRLGALHYARTVCLHHGWDLGIDGWRIPLDPRVGLVRTAGLVTAGPLAPPGGHDRRTAGSKKPEPR